MENIVKNKFNYNKTINEKLPEICDIFIEYYGNEYSTFIKEKLNNTSFICYYPSYEMEQDRKKYEETNANEMITKFILNDFNGVSDKNNLKEIITNYILKNSNESKNLFFKYLEKIDLNGDILSDFQKIYDEIIELKNNNNWLNNYIEDDKKTSVIIEFKLWKDYISKFHNILPKEEINTVTKANNLTELNSSNIPHINYLLGIGLKNNFIKPSMYYFSKKYERLIKTNDIIVNNIKNIRINSLKKLGLDFGDNYDKYMSYSKINDYILDESNMKFILSLKNEYYNKYKTESIVNSKIGKVLKNDFNSKNLLFNDWNKYVQEYLYKDIDLTKRKTISSLMPNLKSNNNKTIINPLIYLNLSSDINIDYYLVSELNYSITTHINKLNDKHYNYKIGLEEGTISYEKINLYNKHHNLNKLINAVITIDIVDLLNKKNLKVFNYDIYKIIDSNIFLIKDFYDAFKPKILESILYGNIKIMYAEVGIKNFDQFSKVIDELIEVNNLCSFDKIKNKINQKIEDISTRRYKNLMIIRDELLKTMINYSNK